MNNKINFPKIYPVACHTDNVGPGSTFVAIEGTKYNGVDFIKLALEKGATKIVVNPDSLTKRLADLPDNLEVGLDRLEINLQGKISNNLQDKFSSKLEEKISNSLPDSLIKLEDNISSNLQDILIKELKKEIGQAGASLELVEDTRLALAQLSAKAHNYPAKDLKIIGITGTKGKSTTVFILEHILREAGYKTALISTIKNKIGDQEFDKVLTTPQPDYLHVFFDICKKEQVDYVILEVAAQALTLNRVYDIQFDAAIFTNFSPEHAEFYKDLDDYFKAKIKIFGQLKPDGKAIYNGDDEKIRQAVSKLRDLQDKKDINYKDLNYSEDKIREHKFVSYGFSNSSDIRLITSNLSLNCTEFSLISKNIEYKILAKTLFGKHNIYNMGAAIACLIELGLKAEAIIKCLESFSFVPGRLERYALGNGSIAFIDYAHNAASFEAILSMLKEYTQNLIVVFGCGGERDRTKRPIMGEIAAKWADAIFLTSDNPRSEDPVKIIDDIFVGVPDYNRHKITIEPDREQAIIKACNNAQNNISSGSIIALLGKGPDEYQLVGNTKKYFSEASILRTFQI